MLRILKIVSLLSLIFFGGCLTSEYNMRVVYDVDRSYIHPDSTQYGMKWHDTKWKTKNIKYWSSAGVIVTNWYNVFQENDWLRDVINNGFEGMIVIQQNHYAVPIDCVNLPVGTFGKDYFNFQITNGTTPFVKALDGMTPILISDQTIIGAGSSTGYYSYALSPHTLNTESYRDGIVDLYVDYILQTKTDLGIESTDNIKFAVMLDDYEYASWNFGTTLTNAGFSFDPDNTAPYTNWSSYSSSDKRTYMSTPQSNLIDAFYNADIPVIVKGTRITTELLENQDLLNGKIIGYMFDDVTKYNISDVETQVATIRTYEDALTEEEALLLIAGIRSDVYNSSKPTEYAALMKRVIDAGMYFTSGSDGFDYWNVPRSNPGDWWVRNNRDSNWQNQAPTYASISSGPRKIITPLGDNYLITPSNTWSTTGDCAEALGERTYTFPTNNALTDSGSLDFSFVYDENTSLFHIIQIPGAHRYWADFITPPKNAAWFQHFTSTDLETWTKQANINLYDATYAKTNVWAPHIIKYGNTWYMYYGAVDATSNTNWPKQVIMVTTSTDLYNWTTGTKVLDGDDFDTGVTDFTNWLPTPTTWGEGDCRDAFVIRNETDDGWLMFFSANGTTAVVGHGGLVVGIASSSSLTGPFLIQDYVRETTSSNYGLYNGESPQVWVEDGTYYLQWATNDGTDPWIDGAVLKTTTPSLGYLNGNTWGAPATSFPYKATEMLTLNNGDRIFGYLELHPTLGGSDYYHMGFRRYTAVPSGTDLFYYSMMANCYDGDPFFTPVAIPTQPTGLDAVVVSTTSIKLFWTPATYEDVFSYNIYRGTSSGSETLLTNTTSLRRFIDTGLTDNQPYYYKIAAVNYNGNISQLSDEITITP